MSMGQHEHKNFCQDLRQQPISENTLQNEDQGQQLLQGVYMRGPKFDSGKRGDK